MLPTLVGAWERWRSLLQSPSYPSSTLAVSAEGSQACAKGCELCSEVNGCLKCSPKLFILLERNDIRQVGVCLPSCPPGYFDARNPDMNKCISECGEGWRRRWTLGEGALNGWWQAGGGGEGTWRRGDEALIQVSSSQPDISGSPSTFPAHVSISEPYLPPPNVCPPALPWCPGPLTPSTREPACPSYHLLSI